MEEQDVRTPGGHVNPRIGLASRQTINTVFRLSSQARLRTIRASQDSGRTGVTQLVPAGQ